MSHENEHPLLAPARREAIASLIIWFLTTVYCVGYCWKYGYGRDPETLTFILGFPDWIFWGIVVPWGVCTVISGLFAFCYMQDADLEN